MNSNIITLPAKPRFPLGKLMLTIGADIVVTRKEIAESVSRHASGDWGLVCEEDTATNDRSVRCGGLILSVYETSKGQRFWIITEGDRSETTVLLPEEY